MRQRLMLKQSRLSTAEEVAQEIEDYWDATEEFSWRRRRVYESFKSRHISQKLLVRTSHWNLAKLVKNYHGIIERPHLVAQKQIAERAIRRRKEAISAVLLQSGLDDKWWSDSMECYTYLRNVQDLLADGKTPYERRIGESFERPIIPIGALVEYLPNSERDKARIHQFGKKVLPGIFPGYALMRGEFGKEIF